MEYNFYREFFVVLDLVYTYSKGILGGNLIVARAMYVCTALIKNKIIGLWLISFTYYI